MLLSIAFNSVVMRSSRRRVRLLHERYVAADPYNARRGRICHTIDGSGWAPDVADEDTY